MIKIEGLWKGFPGLPIFRNTSLEIRKGEIFVLLGPSGSGKTTLAKCIAGLIPPDRGSIHIGDVEISSPDVPPSEISTIYSKVGMVFQKNALFDSLSLLENLTFPQKERKPEEDRDKQGIRSRDLLNRVGIGEFPHIFPDEISGGMQKRLGIARALALDPEILILDDPTAGLDPVTSRVIAELIMELKEEVDATAFVITNDVARAYQMGDRIGLLRENQIQIIGTPKEVSESNDPGVQQFVEGLLSGPFGDFEMTVGS